MSPLISKLTRLARSPQGRRAMSQAAKMAKDPETRRKIEQARARFMKR
jgi:hypothetical protein